MSGQASIMVEIPVEGNWPTPEELEVRNAVIDELEKREVGKSYGAGGGMGAMDFSLRVPDVESARPVIEEVVRKHLMTADFTIKVIDDQP